MERQPKNPRYPSEIKAHVGRQLLSTPRGRQKVMAETLSVTTRTLRTWKKQVKDNQPPRKRGRKKTQVTLVELLAIAREWRRQGCVGALAIINSLKKLRARLVRTVVAELKRRKKLRHNAHVITNRTEVKVNKPCTLTVFDAARVPEQEGSEFIVNRDRASLQTEAMLSVTSATTANDMLTVLGHLKDQGRLPLVAGTDNGSPFVANIVVEFLNENKIIHLKSLPHVPQQNGSAENAVGDVKRQIRDGKTLTQACHILNDCRKRQTLNWKTSTEFNSEHFQPYTEEERNTFYNAAKLAIKQAMLGTKTAYQKRKAEREAIFQTLEDFSLITRTRGRRCA